MKTIIVDQGQCLLDVAVQHTGSVEAVHAIAKANNLCITDDIVPGTAIIIPNEVNVQLVKFLSDNRYVPATGFTTEDEDAEKGGIGNMGIEINFKVL